MTRAHMKLCSLLATGLLALGGGLAQADNEAAIRGLQEQFDHYYTEGDYEGVAQLFTEDAVFIGATGQAVEGRDEILAFFHAHFADGSLQMTTEVIETVVLNDTAYSTNAWEGLDADGNIIVQGYSLSIWKRLDGEWKWHRNVANVVLPEPEEENDMGGSE